MVTEVLVHVSDERCREAERLVLLSAPYLLALATGLLKIDSIFESLRFGLSSFSSNPEDVGHVGPFTRYRAA